MPSMAWARYRCYANSLVQKLFDIFYREENRIKIIKSGAKKKQEKNGASKRERDMGNDGENNNRGHRERGISARLSSRRLMMMMLTTIENRHSTTSNSPLANNIHSVQDSKRLIRYSFFAFLHLSHGTLR